MENDNVQKANLPKVFVGLLLFFGITGFMVNGSSWAQSRRISKIEGGRIHYSTLYKPGAVATLQGQVVSVGKTMSGNNNA